MRFLFVLNLFFSYLLYGQESLDEKILEKQLKQGTTYTIDEAGGIANFGHIDHPISI